MLHRVYLIGSFEHEVLSNQLVSIGNAVGSVLLFADFAKSASSCGPDTGDFLEVARDIRVEELCHAVFVDLGFLWIVSGTFSLVEAAAVAAIVVAVVVIENANETHDTFIRSQ